MKKSSTMMLASIASLASSQAAVTLFAGYQFGEPGSLGTSNIPLDYSGNNRHVTNDISGGDAAVASPGAYAGSTHHLITAGPGNEGWYGPNVGATLPADNFGFSVWTQAAGNIDGTRGDVLSLGGGSGALKLSLDANGWTASSHLLTYIGPDGGVTGSFSPDIWTHLMLIRQNGTATFYINGTAHGSFSGDPAHGDLHISVNPGGTRYFDGLLDEARIVTFDGTDSLAEIQTALIPEPSGIFLSSFGILSLLRRRR